MSVRTYRFIMVFAMSLAIVSGSVTLGALFTTSLSGVEILCSFAFTGACVVLACTCTYRILFPHDHPAPRYRRDFPSGSHRAP